MARRIWRRQSTGRLRSRDLIRRRPGEQAAVLASAELLETTSALAISARAGQMITLGSGGAIFLATVTGGTPTFDSLLSSSQTANFNGNDNTAALLGLWFKVLTPGYLWGVRFYNPNAAARKIFLFDRHDSSTAGIVASAMSTADAGWQDVFFPTPVAVGPTMGYGSDGQYIVSYFSPIIEGFGSGQYVTIAGGARTGDNGPFGHVYLENVESVFTYSTTAENGDGSGTVPQTNYSNDSYGIAPLFALTDTGGGTPVITAAINVKAGSPDLNQRLGALQTGVGTVSGSAASPDNAAATQQVVVGQTATATAPASATASGLTFGILQDAAIASPIRADASDSLVGVSQNAFASAPAGVLTANSVSMEQTAIGAVPAVLTAVQAIGVLQDALAGLKNGIDVAQSLGIQQTASGILPITLGVSQGLGTLSAAAVALLEQGVAAQSVDIQQTATASLVSKVAAPGQNLVAAQSATGTVIAEAAATQPVDVQQAICGGPAVATLAMQDVGARQAATIAIGSGILVVQTIGLQQTLAAKLASPAATSSQALSIQQNSSALVPVVASAVSQSISIQQQATVDRVAKVAAAQSLAIQSSSLAAILLRAAASGSLSTQQSAIGANEVKGASACIFGVQQSAAILLPVGVATDQRVGMESTARIELLVGLYGGQPLGIEHEVVVEMPIAFAANQSLGVGQELVFEARRSGIIVRLQGVVLERRSVGLAGSAVRAIKLERIGLQ